jgi:4-hydroxybenzoate polyprenyltransferase
MGRSPASIAARLRFRDWGPGKIPFLCTLAAFIGLAGGNWSRPFIVEFGLILFAAMAHSALGFVVNDFGDREIDRAQGKPNAFETLSPLGGMLFLGGLLLVSFLSGLPFVGRPYFIPCWAGWVFVALAYSLPPLRLKERGVWGLGVAAVAQWTLPVLLVFAALGRLRGWELAVFALAATVSGATLEVGHQRHDRQRDRQTKTTTLGAVIDDDRLDRLYGVMIRLDKAALGLIVLTVAFSLPRATGFLDGRTMGGLILLVYLGFLAASLVEAARCRARIADPYYGPAHSAGALLHQTFPNLVLPAALLLLLAVHRPLCLVLLGGFLYWRLVIGKADWGWPWRRFRQFLRK